MKKKIIPFFILTVITFFSCESSEDYTTLPAILVNESFKNKAYITLSDFVEDIDYIILETVEENIIAKNPEFYANDSVIIVSAFRQIFLFERKTGKFIREISRFGRGPGEYGATIRILPYDESRGIIMASSWDMETINEYDLYGNYLRTIKAPENVSNYVYLKDNVLAAFIKNHTGYEERRIVLFDDNSKIIKTYPNYNFMEPSLEFVGWNKHGWFYRYHDKLCFFELFTDTIYHVTEHELIPRFVFKMGEYELPYEKQQSAEFMKTNSMNYFRIREIFESENYLFFKVRFDRKEFHGLYNKIAGSTFFAQGNSGFENDIDDFIPFSYSSITDRDELIGYAEGFKVELWFMENPDKAAQLPAHLKELESLTENDNPVVMIARLKEYICYD